MFSNSQLRKILKKEKLLATSAFNKLIEEASKAGENTEDFITLEKKIVTQKDLYKMASRYYKIPLITLKEEEIKREILEKIPEAFAVRHNLAAFALEKNILKIATLNPQKLDIFESIKKQTGLKLKIYLTTPDNLKTILNQYHESLKAEFDYLGQREDSKYFSAQEEKKNLTAKGLKKIAQEIPVVKILNSLLRQAILDGASDIHIEPEENSVIVRFRIDGVLKQIMSLPQEAQSGITARVKILANLKVDEHRMPQDGRFKISSDRYKVSFRVSLVPIYGGEKIVMRLLPEESGVKSLEQLGFEGGSLETIKKNISKPHGMILVTGPTGSGKTTTLYTILNILNKPEVNISTIEDPIEYRMPRINQSQVNPKIGYTFAIGLRAFLRQDPDIIMVGEIRDTETANVSVNAAMTGHLLLSTLHTNDAVSAIPRLINIGAASFLVAFTSNVIIAQRLVRKICPNCVQSYKFTNKLLEEMNKQFDIKSILKTLKTKKIVSKSIKTLSSINFYKGKGCNKCSNSGYKGRIGIYETLEVTPEISQLILKNARHKELLDLARSQGMLTMVEDGFIKARDGITSVEEIMRVTKE